MWLHGLRRWRPLKRRDWGYVCLYGCRRKSVGAGLGFGLSWTPALSDAQRRYSDISGSRLAALYKWTDTLPFYVAILFSLLDNHFHIYLIFPHVTILKFPLVGQHCYSEFRIFFGGFSSDRIRRRIRLAAPDERSYDISRKLYIESLTVAPTP